ncbi:hypothetical protein CIHG_04265 [Coccidioides immitis H538.4]|uniref:Uncharacterized protein n=1 Tax=Coccidioides immitis H538.4 TaxID=396776 RepID=A0A0J8RPE6_COCIT|nr:hypothetical protein CIHG_04265 [Coccidioides immitis H538.4]
MVASMSYETCLRRRKPCKVLRWQSLRADDIGTIHMTSGAGTDALETMGKRPLLQSRFTLT